MNYPEQISSAQQRLMNQHYFERLSTKAFAVGRTVMQIAFETIEKIGSYISFPSKFFYEDLLISAESVPIFCTISFKQFTVLVQTFFLSLRASVENCAPLILKKYGLWVVKTSIHLL